MKVCILQNKMAFGGTDTFVINLALGLIERGHDVMLIVSTNDLNEFGRANELEKIKVKTTCELRGIKGKILHLVKLFKILCKFRPDVFQTNIDLFNGPNLLIAWLARVPIRECHSHNSQQSKEIVKGKKLVIKIYQKIMRWMCWTFSNRRGGCSKIAMDFLFQDKWKKDKKSKVVYNGIDFSDYRTDLDVIQEKNKLGINNTYNICTVGRMSFQKNPLFIVEVLNELFKMRDDCEFWWVGTGELESEVRKKVEFYKIEDKIHFLGTRKDIAKILSVMDLFFLPSLFEGLAIVLIEAQAAQLPCVTSTTTTSESDCGSLLYVSLDESAQYWAKKMCDVLDKKIFLQVNKEKMQKYSMEHMVKEMEKLFI